VLEPLYLVPAAISRLTQKWRLLTGKPGQLQTISTDPGTTMLYRSPA